MAGGKTETRGVCCNFVNFFYEG